MASEHQRVRPRFGLRVTPGGSRGLRRAAGRGLSLAARKPPLAQEVVTRGSTCWQIAQLRYGADQMRLIPKARGECHADRWEPLQTLACHTGRLTLRNCHPAGFLTLGRRLPHRALRAGVAPLTLRTGPKRCKNDPARSRAARPSRPRGRAPRCPNLAGYVFR